MSFPLAKGKEYLCLGSRGRILMLRARAPQPQAKKLRACEFKVWGIWLRLRIQGLGHLAS